MAHPPLTDKQQAILDFVQETQAERGFPPSSREIQKQFGYDSQNAVMNHLRALGRKGMLARHHGRTWGVKGKPAASASAGALFTIPLYGTIAAGSPAAAEQVADETVRIDPALFRLQRADRRRLWALRVSGDSMVNAHIVDGDLAILERREPREGEIIAALVDETTTTLKRLRYREGSPVLHPENPRYRDILPQSGLECQGVLVGIVRRAVASPSEPSNA